MAAILVSASQAAAELPADFHLIASAGGIPPWEENRSVEVSADGSGACFRTKPPHRETGKMTSTARFQLAATKVQSLIDAVDDAGFFSLPAEHPSDAQDGTYATLIVTARGTTHQVTTENVALPDFDAIMRLVNSMVPPICQLTYNEILR